METRSLKKQLEIIGIVALLGSVRLSGCDNVNTPFDVERNKFIGTWQNTTRDNISVYNYTIILFSDGKCSINDSVGVWDLKDNNLVIEIPNLGSFYTFNYVFSNNDRILSLSSATSSGSTVVFTKQ